MRRAWHCELFSCFSERNKAGLMFLIYALQCVHITFFGDCFMSTSMIHVRIDDEVKRQAVDALASMGLSVSDAVRVLLFRIAQDKAFPFTLQAPNATTLQAIHEVEHGDVLTFTSAQDLFNELEKDR